jgi:preprotein translocase subunit SecD
VRRHVVFLIVSILVVLVPMGAVVATNTTPQLGLDLQGGVSVVLAPKEKVKPDALTKAVDIIRNRVDSLGVAEPEISRQGENIIIDLPGVKNQERARRLVGRTAELRFRPVLQVLPPEGVEVTTTTTTAPALTTTTAAGATTTSGPTTSTTKQGGAVTAGQATTTSATTPPPAPAGDLSATTTTTVPPATGKVPTSAEDDPNQIVVLPVRAGRGEEEGQRMRLGPAELTGRAVSSAKSELIQGGWGVALRFNKEGSAGFDALAAKNFGQRVAIVLDGVVQSAPTIQSQKFEGRAQITGSFTQSEAKDLALVLRYGSLPITLEEQTVEQVSPTLGKDQLRSGIAAGLMGLALVALYMLIYYRLLGVVIWTGLLLTAGFLYVVTCWLGQAIGLTLTLAGVTGIIVSVGITVDSYVVYFERLKDEVRSGKTIRSSLDRGFARSFKTILAADLVSLIGAGLLYLLAVGSVRGFALFLGISTLLDILVAYFFMHPLVSIIARNPSFTRARWLGVAEGLQAKGATA